MSEDDNAARFERAFSPDLRNVASSSVRHNPIIDALKPFISKTKQWTFFDFDFRSGTIDELRLRLIPGAHLYHVLSIYASINCDLSTRLQNATKKSTPDRVYKCFCDKLRFKVQCTNPDSEKAERLYRVTQIDNASHNCRCRSVPIKTNRMQNSTISSVVIANHPAIRGIVRKNVLLDKPCLAQKIRDAPILRGRQLPQSGTFDNIARDLQIVYHFMMRQYYHLLPKYLLHFYELNPGSTVALQSDDCNQFYRLFVGFPMAKYHGILTLPILVVDCFHYQCPQYDGTAIVMVTKTGFGSSVFLAFGIIPSEDTNSVGWFLQMCSRHGIDYAKSPLFTDQGPLLSAARILTQQYEYTFIIMLCLQHLLRNVRHKFLDYVKGAGSNFVELSLRHANQVTSMEDFFDILTAIVDHIALCFPEEIDNVVKMGLYIAQYHPSHWTTFANLPDFIDAKFEAKREQVIASWYAAREAAAAYQPISHNSLSSTRKLIKRSNRLGEQLARQSGFKKIVDNIKGAPLFYVSTTNAAESEASAMYRCGGRCYIP